MNVYNDVKREVDSMPGNINFDHALLEEALKVGGHKYKKDAVNAALKEYVERHKQLKILDLFGTINYDKDYDYKKGRHRR